LNHYLTKHYLNVSKKPIVIVFIGNVGAGKTTHILITFNALRRRGYRIHKTYVKTYFIITTLLSKLYLLQRTTWRIAIALDLLLNSIYLPLAIWFRTIVFPIITKKHLVLVEEHLLGSLVDYIISAIILNLTPVTLPTIRLLFKLSRGITWHKIIYVIADKSLLPIRWRLRGTRTETRVYLLVQDLVFKIATKHCSNVLYLDTTRDLSYNSHVCIKFLLNKNKI
jgi:hypothetical protein